MQPKPFMKLALLALLCLFTGMVNGQNQTPPSQSTYDAHSLWAPLFYPHYGNQYRSANGQPGPAYWKNEADYKIACTLDTTQKRLTGTVEITYKNNSPDNLSFFWLQIDHKI
jgi:hypothetical protein